MLAPILKMDVVPAGFDLRVCRNRRSAERKGILVTVRSASTHDLRTDGWQWVERNRCRRGGGTSSQENCKGYTRYWS